MAIEQREIVVVGAGPAGSSAAREAALAGLRPLLVEKDDSPGAHNVCGGVAAYGYRRKLELTDDVVEREIWRTVVRVDGANFEFNSGRPTQISFRRAVFDSFLAEQAVQAGAELLTSTRVVGVDPSSRRIELKNLVTGREHEMGAQIIVFADGPATLAADALGIGHRPGPNTIRAVIMELEGKYEDGETMEFVVDTSARNTGYFWIFPKRGFVQVGVGGILHDNSKPFGEQLVQFINRRSNLRERKLLHKVAGLVPCERSRHLVADGAMVAGDAAGLASPLTGGGIGIALISGEIAGRVAASAVKSGSGDRRALLPYAKRLQRTSQYLWLAATTHWYRRLDRVEPAARSSAYAEMLRRYLGFYHHMRSFVDIILR